MSDAAEQEAKTWIEAVLGESFGSSSFAEALQDGTRLCRLVNTIKPGAIPKFTEKPAMEIKKRENITYVTQALKKWGLRDFENFSTLDLADGKNIKAVVITMHALGRLLQTGEFAALSIPKLGKRVEEKHVRASASRAISTTPSLPL